VSPQADFPSLTFRLRLLAKEMPVIGMSSAGDLCSTETGAPLYLPAGSPSVVVQVFSPGLIEAVSIHSIALPNDDIHRGVPSLPWDERVTRLFQSLASIDSPFVLTVRDCFALIFIDGLAHCEGEFMEAVYACNRFTVPFAGGLAVTHLDHNQAFVSDGQGVLALFSRTSLGRSRQS